MAVPAECKADPTAPLINLLECPACAYQYDLWTSVLTHSTVEAGHRAFAAMALESHLKDWPETKNEVDLQEWEDLQTVRRVIRQIEEQRNFEQWQQNQQQSKS